MKLMSKEDIPAFVQDILETGCDMCAVDYDGYMIGDADLPPAKRNKVQPILRRISVGMASATIFAGKLSYISAPSVASGERRNPLKAGLHLQNSGVSCSCAREHKVAPGALD
ncbi:hypothetical protein [Mesorhizobium sp. LNHC221B00]|uniref:hypothetical protein n=1 Tax=Mesorhizobium sp. LNHC221B00 TaxID=1287233 RepID=UPI002678AC30